MDTDLSFEDSTLVLAWGSTVTLAWALTVGMGMASLGVKEVMAIWSILMAVPLVMTAGKYLEGDSNRLFNFWAVITVLLMVENFLASGAIAFYSYFHLWIVAGAIGFYYTSKRLPPPSDSTYRYGALASVLALGVALFQPLAAPVAALLVQGTPLLYDWYTVHR